MENHHSHLQKNIYKLIFFLKYVIDFSGNHTISLHIVLIQPTEKKNRDDRSSNVDDDFNVDSLPPSLNKTSSLSLRQVHHHHIHKNIREMHLTSHTASLNRVDIPSAQLDPRPLFLRNVHLTFRVGRVGHQPGCSLPDDRLSSPRRVSGS